MSDLGTKVTDVLELYAQEIARAQDAGHCLDDSTTVGEAKSMAIRDLAAALRAERERVAEMEPDAKLGRMVNKMKRRSALYHEAGIDPIIWQYVDFESGTQQQGDTAKAALEAARKEET